MLRSISGSFASRTCARAPGPVDRPDVVQDELERLKDLLEVQVLEALHQRVEVRALEVDMEAAELVRGVGAAAETGHRIVQPVVARQADRNLRVQVVCEAGERSVGRDPRVEAELARDHGEEEARRRVVARERPARVVHVVQELPVADRVADRADVDLVLVDRLADELGDVRVRLAAHELDHEGVRVDAGRHGDVARPDRLERFERLLDRGGGRIACDVLRPVGDEDERECDTGGDGQELLLVRARRRPAASSPR